MRKKDVVSCWTTVRKNGLLFIPTSGHTGFDLFFGGTQNVKSLIFEFGSFRAKYVGSR